MLCSVSVHRKVRTEGCAAGDGVVLEPELGGRAGGEEGRGREALRAPIDAAGRAELPADELTSRVSGDEVQANCKFAQRQEREALAAPSYNLLTPVSAMR